MDQTELEEVEYEYNGASVMSPTLGELLRRVEQSRRMSGDETPAHEIIELGETLYGGTRSSLPFLLSFDNLTYKVKVRRKLTFSTCFRRKNRLGAVDERTESNAFSDTKTLLNGISGEARDGEMLAVLGASGSGKSTLIDALANRISKDSLKGRVSLNGEALESRLLKVISAYVMQDDLLYPMLTVEETLMFAAEFRLPRSLSKSKKAARVEALIDQLGLRRAAKTVIGDEGHRGVSGGERRRVSIGIDIIHDPIILFLDEPTSGLDSTSAFMVVKNHRLARPSAHPLSRPDRLQWHARHSPFLSRAIWHPVPENENRLEFALDLIRELEASPNGNASLVEFNKSWQQERRNSSKLDFHCLGSSLKDAISASISKGKLVCGTTTNNSSTNSKSTMPTYANPFWTEINVLAKRSVINSWRMPELFGMRLGSVMVTGFIIATMFWQLDDSPRGVQERLGFFAFAMSTAFYTCADALPVFIQERYIFMRETAYNAYRRSSYVLARIIVVIPSLIFLATAFSLTTFWAVGLSGGLSGFWFYFLVVLAAFWAGSSFVSFISGVVRQVMLGYTVVVALLAYCFLFSGFFINRDRLPPYWIWFHYISLVKYPFEAVMQNEFGDPAKCFVRGIQIFDSTPLKVLPSEKKLELLESISKSLGMSITSGTCLTTGSDILVQEAITQLSKWNCFWATAWISFVSFISNVVRQVMLGYTVVVALLAYCFLFSGFFINRDRLPPYWIWFHYISLVKYPFEAVMQNEFGDPAKCFVRGIQIFDSTPLKVLPTEKKLELLESISKSLGMSITQLSKWNCFWATGGEVHLPPSAAVEGSTSSPPRPRPPPPSVASTRRTGDLRGRPGRSPPLARRRGGK
ncbi:hypothetical protein Sjap_013272 [Stephania japonica]|uniref:ABC transporter domain-containing protein n=1 Tax=Stephania japonica TaxID=461633 RepID=A0AAP0NZQ3_9MAGN